METVEQLRKEARVLLQDTFWRGTESAELKISLALPEYFDNVTDQILSIFLDQTKDDCPECGGKGIKSYSGRASDGFDTCENCNGTGKVGEWHDKRLVVLDEDQSLPDKNENNTWYNDEFGEAGKIGWDLGVQDMLRANFMRIE